MAKRNRRPKKKSDIWVEDIQQDIKNDAKSVEDTFVPRTAQELSRALDESVDKKQIAEDIDQRTYINNDYDFMLKADDLDESTQQELQDLVAWLSIDRVQSSPSLLDMQKILQSIYNDVYTPVISQTKLMYVLQYTPLTQQWRQWFEGLYTHFDGLHFYNELVTERELQHIGIQQLYNAIQTLWCTDQSIAIILERAETYGIGVSPEIAYTWVYEHLQDIYAVDYVLKRLQTLPRSDTHRDLLGKINKAYPDPLLRQMIVETETALQSKWLFESEAQSYRSKISLLRILFHDQVDMKSMYNFHLKQMIARIRNGNNTRSIIESILNDLGHIQRDYEQFDGLIETMESMRNIYDEFIKKILLVPKESKINAVNAVNILFWAAFVDDDDDVKDRIKVLDDFRSNMQKHLKEWKELDEVIVRSLNEVWYTQKNVWIEESATVEKIELGDEFTRFEIVREQTNKKLFTGIGRKEDEIGITNLDLSVFQTSEALIKRIFEIVKLWFTYPMLENDVYQWETYYDLALEMYYHCDEMNLFATLDIENDAQDQSLHIWSSWLKLVWIQYDKIPQYLRLELLLQWEDVLQSEDSRFNSVRYNRPIEIENENGDKETLSYFDLICMFWQFELAKNILDRKDMLETKESWWMESVGIDRTKTVERLKSDFTEKKLNFLKNNFKKSGNYLVHKDDYSKHETLMLEIWRRKASGLSYDETKFDKIEKVNLYDIDWQSIVHHMVDDESMSDQDLERCIKWLGDDFDFSTTNSQWLTSLIYALEGKKFKKAKFLIDFFLFKIRVATIANELNGKSIVHYMSHFSSNQIKILLDLITKIPQFRARLVGYKHLFEISNFKKLLQHKNPETNLTWLQTLAEYGHIELVKELMQQYSVDIWGNIEPFEFKRDVVMSILQSPNANNEVKERFVFKLMYAESARERRHHSYLSKDHELLQQKSLSTLPKQEYMYYNLAEKEWVMNTTDGWRIRYLLWLDDKKLYILHGDLNKNNWWEWRIKQEWELYESSSISHFPSQEYLEHHKHERRTYSHLNQCYFFGDDELNEQIKKLSM